MFKILSEFFRDERGQGLVEYTFILILVAIAAMAAFNFFGGRAGNYINTSANNI